MHALCAVTSTEILTQKRPEMNQFRQETNLPLWLEVFIFYCSKVIFEFLFNRFLKTKILYDGSENITDHPALFVANHYTRIETGILPYVHYKVTGKKLFVLADSSFFVGFFGTWLRICGAYPLQDPNRNKRIIGDLMTGKSNWAIFPEGNMVKNRSVYDRGKFVLDCPDKKGPPHTGAAVLALKAEIFKRSYLRAVENEDRVSMQYYENTYGFSGPEDIPEKTIVISPVSISFFPLRTDGNALMSLLRMKFKKMHPRMEEELLVEGSFLFNHTDVDHQFGPAIHLDSYVNHLMPIKKGLQKFFRDEDINNLILEWQRSKLTQKIMREIYQRIYANIDEVFAYALRAIPAELDAIDEQHFRRAVYLSCLEILDLPDVYTHSSLHGDLQQILIPGGYAPLEDILETSVKEKHITRFNHEIILNRDVFHRDYHFHRIRVHNKLWVLANGIEPLDNVTRIIRVNVGLLESKSKAKVRSVLKEIELEEYKDDLHSYPQEGEMASQNCFSIEYEQSHEAVGILLFHDLVSTPHQMVPLAEKLHQQGYHVFCPRLKGHGTNSQDLAQTTRQDWIQSAARAYSQLSSSCHKVIVGGYSMGALLALQLAAKDPHGIGGILSINPALAIKDQDQHILRPILWAAHWARLIGRPKEWLEKMDLEVNADPFHYQDVYYSSLYQAKLLARETRQMLDKIHCPLLTIQSIDDPVLAGSSGQELYDTVPSRKKGIYHLEFHRDELYNGQAYGKFLPQLEQFLKEEILV